jgi:exosortase K
MTIPTPHIKRTLIYSSLLLLAYLSLRILFQQFPVLKSLFIYPTGILVNAFYTTGTYTDSQWIYIFEQTKFVLGESCSGTTFFSLLFAYFIYSIAKHNIPLAWLVLTYPIALIANTMRILSSINAQRFLAHTNADSYSDAIHVIMGTITFVSCLLLVALFIGRTRKSLSHAKASPTR